MAEDALLTAIEEDGRSQINSILKEAEDAAGEILRAAEAEAASIREERLKAAREALARKKAASLNSAGTRMEALITEAKKRAIADALSESVDGFRKMPEDEYAGVLKRLYGELKREWEGDGVKDEPVVLVNPADEGVFKKMGVEVRADPSVGLGAVFASKDGCFRYENTIPARLLRVEKAAALAAAKILFG